MERAALFRPDRALATLWGVSGTRGPGGLDSGVAVMPWVRRVRAIVLSAAILCGPCATAGARDSLAGPNALDDGILIARALLEGGDCREGMDSLEALLGQHEAAEYAKARCREIEDLMIRLACGTRFKPPKPTDLVSGTLQSWSPRTGKIKIKYTPKRAADLGMRDGLYVLPAHLNGPLVLEIRGRSYPTTKRDAPRITFGGDQHPDTGKVQSWRIDLGLATRGEGRRGSKVSGSILHMDGGSEEVVAEKTVSAGKSGKAYKLVLRVTKTKISATLNGRSVGSAKKDKAVYGYLCFRAGSWTEARLSGSIDPAWLRGQLEERFRKQLGEFAKSYEKSENLPAWLSEPMRREASIPIRRPVDLVARLDEKHYGMMMDVDNDIREEELDRALAGIDKMQAAGVPEATCEFLRAKARKFTNQLEASLGHLKHCLELEPEYLDGFLMRCALLRQLGRFDEALEIFEQASGAHAEVPSIYEEAASTMLLAGRPDDAKRMTRLAARNGVYSPRLVSLTDALSKIINGPDWLRKYEHKSRNYHVLSDIDQMICIEASRLLEESFDAFREKIGWVESDETRLFRVYLFNKRDDFMAYQGHMKEYMGKPTDWAAGLYSPLLKQLLIWNPRKPEDMMTTIRHEGFHQYLDRIMPNPPTWVNEGLAVYHENGVRKDGKLVFGEPRPWYVRVLKDKGLLPLDKFLFSGAPPFYEDGHRSYGQAWLLVHMLRHTTPAYRKLFDGIMADLKGSAVGVLRKWFPPESVAPLEKDLRAYLDKLARS